MATAPKRRGTGGDTHGERQASSPRKAELVLLPPETGFESRLAEGLRGIADGDASARAKAANSLRDMFKVRNCPGAFAPLLDAAEKEGVPGVKAALLEAIENASYKGRFRLPPDTVARLEKLIFAETNPAVIYQACFALYQCLPPEYGRGEAQGYFNELQGRASRELGAGHQVTTGIVRAIGAFISEDLV